MNEFITAVCSNKPRPQVHNNQHPHGAESWRKDTYHAAGTPYTTECGIDCSEWIIINDEMPIDAALSDFHFCLRCARKIRKETP